MLKIFFFSFYYNYSVIDKQPSTKKSQTSSRKGTRHRSPQQEAANFDYDEMQPCSSSQMRARYEMRAQQQRQARPQNQARAQPDYAGITKKFKGIISHAKLGISAANSREAPDAVNGLCKLLQKIRNNFNYFKSFVVKPSRVKVQLHSIERKAREMKRNINSDVSFDLELKLIYNHVIYIVGANYACVCSSRRSE